MIRYNLIGFFVACGLLVSLIFPTSVLAMPSVPEKIIIPRIGINLPVSVAQIVFDTWEVHLDGASFGEGSPLPGTNGNAIIFSHALPELFGNLNRIKKNDYVHIFTNDDWYVYQVYKTETVNPDKTSVLDSNGSAELTLYTCVGLDWSRRFVVKAKLLSTPELY